MQENLKPTPFDATARGYDFEFTETQVGRMQRAVTHRYLQELIASAKPQTALELNCGTGEDALWLANQGLLVTATDLSAEKVVGKGVRVLQTGSLLLMKGETQRFWQHSLPKSKRVVAPRVNFTFRRMKG
jgi:hypothetical protein